MKHCSSNHLMVTLVDETLVSSNSIYVYYYNDVKTMYMYIITMHELNWRLCFLIGSLVIKNKTMEHRSSKILRQSIRKATVIPSPSAGRRTPVPRIIEVSDEFINVLELLYKVQEEDHKRALDKIQQLRDGRIKKAPQIVEGNWLIFV